MKTITAILIIIFSSSAFSQIKFKWLGITATTISDGKTTLFFDPAITRFGPLDFLPFKKIQSNHAEVDYWLNRCGVKSVQATIVNHAHTDHVIDAPYVTKKLIIHHFFVQNYKIQNDSPIRTFDEKDGVTS
jgi:beta-lactamase superfamily II metal-dependent hydrolase